MSLNREKRCSRSRRKILIIILSLAILLIPTVTAVGDVYNKYSKYHVPVVIHAVDEKGKDIDSATFYVYTLTKEGAVKVLEGTIREGYGTFSIEVKKTTNLLVVVYRVRIEERKKLIGPRVFFILPGEKAKHILVQTRSIPIRKSTSEGTPKPHGEVIGECDNYTRVLEFWVQDQIEAYWDYPIGAVLEIQTKEREWTTDTPSGEPELVYDWRDCGSTGVELDTGTGTTVPITKAHHIVEMLFHYIDDMVQLDPTTYLEVLYAVDTGSDGNIYKTSTTTWDNGPPSSYVDTAVTEQGHHKTFKLSSAYTYVWYPSISMGVSYPWGVSTSISVPLGVNKVSQPYATLRIEVPVIGGDYIVRSYDVKGGWLKSYHVWESP